METKVEIALDAVRALTEAQKAHPRYAILDEEVSHAYTMVEGIAVYAAGEPMEYLNLDLFMLESAVETLVQCVDELPYNADQSIEGEKKLRQLRSKIVEARVAVEDHMAELMKLAKQQTAEEKS